MIFISYNAIFAFLAVMVVSASFYIWTIKTSPTWMEELHED